MKILLIYFWQYGPFRSSVPKGLKDVVKQAPRLYLNRGFPKFSCLWDFITPPQQMGTTPLMAVSRWPYLQCQTRWRNSGGAPTRRRKKQEWQSQQSGTDVSQMKWQLIVSQVKNGHPANTWRATSHNACSQKRGTLSKLQRLLISGCFDRIYWGGAGWLLTWAQLSAYCAFSLWPQQPVLVRHRPFSSGFLRFSFCFSGRFISWSDVFFQLL